MTISVGLVDDIGWLVAFSVMMVLSPVVMPVVKQTQSLGIASKWCFKRRNTGQVSGMVDERYDMSRENATVLHHKSFQWKVVRLLLIFLLSVTMLKILTHNLPLVAMHR